MKSLILLRARLFAIVASGTAVAATGACERGARPAPTPSPPSPPTAEPNAQEGAAEDAGSGEDSPEPGAVPIATGSATQSPAPRAPVEPVESHPPPTPARTCARPTTRCHPPHTAMGGQVEPEPSEYDKNGCLSGNRVSGACQGFYAQKGPTFDGKQCCYVGCTGPVAPCGRPLLVDGIARTAGACERDDWAHSFADLEQRAQALPDSLRHELARGWQNDALLEHASVAAFSRFVLELMALGAPAHLVAAAVASAADEIEHAKICFGLSRAFGGVPCGPGPLDLGGVAARTDLAGVVAAVVEEACCAETSGALVCARQRELATDPSVAAALGRIAEDEARHAELGWAFVRWAVERGGPEIHTVVRAAFERGIDRLLRVPADHSDPRAAAFGRLGRREVESVVKSAIEKVIRPTLARLLGERSRAVSQHSRARCTAQADLTGKQSARW